jgi:hypothetical protein
MNNSLTVADRQMIVDHNNKVVDRVDFAVVQILKAHINLIASVVVI